MCYAKIDEAEKIANNLEAFHLLFEINFYKKKLILNSREKIIDFSIQLENLIAVDNDKIRTLTLLHKLFQTFMELNGIYHLRDLDNPKIPEIRKRLDLFFTENNSEIADSFELFNYFYLAKILLLQLRKSLTASEKDEIIESFQLLLAKSQSDKYKTIIDNDPNRYIQLLHNFVISAVRIGRFDAIPDIDFNALFNNKIQDYDNVLFINNILTVRDIYSQHWQRAKDRINNNVPGKIEVFFEIHKDKITTHHKIAYIYNILLVEFVCGDYVRANYWTDQILQETYRNVNIDHIILVKFIQIILQIIEEHPNVDMTLRNVYEYIKRHEKMTPINRQVYDFFGQFIETKHDKKLKVQTLAEHKAICQATIAESHTLKPYNVFLAWMDMEMTNQPIKKTIAVYLAENAEK